MFCKTALLFLPIIEPASLPDPLIGICLSQNPIQRLDRLIQLHAFLEGKNNPAVMRITLSQDNKIPDVIRENGATLSSRAKQLLLITGIKRHPFSGSAG